METIETENKLDRNGDLKRELEKVGREYITAEQKYREVCLAAMDLMLSAGNVYWGDDFFQLLKDERGMISLDLEHHEIQADVDDDNRHTKATMKLSDVVSDWPAEQIETLSSFLKGRDLEDVLQLKVA